jgi:PTS system nitrogen regulatory IIA component
MQLRLSEVAGLFSVSETCVHDWVRGEGLPAHVVKTQYRFNRSEVLEWAALHHRAIPQGLAPETGLCLSVSAALEAGAVIAAVPGGTPEEVFSHIVATLRAVPADDRALLVELLLAREAAGTTSVGGGIAIPHPARPIMLAQDLPQIALAYLREPLDLGAADGKPIRTLFLLLTPTAHCHLQLLGILSRLLSNEEFRTAIERQAGPEVILPLARRLEAA